MIKKQFLSIVLAATMVFSNLLTFPVNSLSPVIVHAAEQTKYPTIANGDEFQEAMKTAKNGDTFVLNNKRMKGNFSLNEDEYPSVKTIRFLIDSYNEEDNLNDFTFVTKINLPGRNIIFDYTERLNNYQEGFFVSIEKGVNVKSLTVKGDNPDDYFTINHSANGYHFDSLTIQNVAVDFYNNPVLNGNVYLKNVRFTMPDYASLNINGKTTLENTFIKDQILKKIISTEGIETIENSEAVSDATKIINMINNLDVCNPYEVEEVRAAYDALSDEEKAKVNNLSILEEAEEELAKEQGNDQENDDTSDKDKAEDVYYIILEALESGNKEDILNARKAYDALTDAQKAFIDENTYNSLVQKEEDIKKAEQEAADKKAVSYVMNLINNASADNEESVKKAREAYDALNDEQKTYIHASSNMLEKLLALEKEVEEKKIAEEKSKKDKIAADRVIDLILNANDKNSVEKARESYNDLTTVQKALIDSEILDKLVEKENALKEEDTENIPSDEPANPETSFIPDKPATVSASKVVIKGETRKMAPGKRIQLKATVYPAKTTNKKITWTSSNKKIATVNANGLVLVSKKAGGKRVVITAQCGKAKSSYVIIIAKGVVKKIKLTGKKTVKAGKTLKLKAKVEGTKGAYKGLKWKSSNAKYASVSNGKVKTFKAGKGKKVAITAMALDGSGKKAKISITIK